MEIRLSDLGDNIETAHVAQWLVSDGDDILPGDDLVELVTDKASFIASSPYRGKLEIRIKDGSEIQKSDVIATIKDRG